MKAARLLLGLLVVASAPQTLGAGASFSESSPEVRRLWTMAVWPFTPLRPEIESDLDLQEARRRLRLGEYVAAIGLLHDVEARLPDEFGAGSLTLGELLRESEHLLSVRRYEAALLVSTLADSIAFFEARNIYAALFQAESHCGLGERGAGLRRIDDFLCMLEVDRGVLDCGDSEASAGCEEKMCADIFLPEYSARTEEWRQAHEARYLRDKAVALAIQDSCEN